MDTSAGEWQLVIPMSGFGERFRRAGYTVPKPLIPVGNRPIIWHVVDMYPGVRDILFICNQEHLNTPEYRMREILEEACPSGRVLGIAPHKLGPVYAVSQAFDLLRQDAPVVVNYCDFSCSWDWEGFRRFAADTACDGAVMCYTGFHPHMLHSVNYAYVLTHDGDRVERIQEKQPFTPFPMREYASSGAYYFRSAALMREAFAETLRRPDLLLKGEYYVSLAYRPLLEKKKDIRVFPIDRFCQWGTPQDLREYECHMRYKCAEAAFPTPPRQEGAVLMPVAGMGSRFAKEGYELPKPLIPVNGRPMLLNAWRSLPRARENRFVLRREMPGAEDLAALLRREVPAARVILLDGPTDGQARTCLLGLDGVDMDAPLTIGACDNGLAYDPAVFRALMADAGVDFIIWTVRGYPGAVRHPEMYGWVALDPTGAVESVSVKRPLASPGTDPVVTGAFTFKRAGDFVRSVERMMERGRQVNGEFYVDECLNDALRLGLRGATLDVIAYLCWGTPDDLKTYQYWR